LNTKVRVIHDKAIAFVTYYLRGSAEFAKEAMCDQHLSHGEVLNVRWATEDPNPRAKAQKYEDTEGQMLAAVRARYGDVGYYYPEYNQYAAPYYGAPNSFYNYYPLEYAEGPTSEQANQIDPANPSAILTQTKSYPAINSEDKDGKEPPTKKPKITNTSTSSTSNSSQPAFLAMYPNTDSQYPDMDFNKKEDKSPSSQENGEQPSSNHKHPEDHLVTLQQHRQQLENQQATADPQSFYYNYNAGSYVQPGYDYAYQQQYTYYYDPYQASTESYQNPYYQQPKNTKPLTNNDPDPDDDDDEEDNDEDSDTDNKSQKDGEKELVGESKTEQINKSNNPNTTTQEQEPTQKENTIPDNSPKKEIQKSKKRKVTEDNEGDD